MKQYVAALDIGTSKMVAAVAGKDGTGNFLLLAQARESSDNSIRRGCIDNDDTVAGKVAALIQNLNRQLKNQACPPLEKIYVGIGGQSIHTREQIVKKEIKDGKISPELLSALRKEAEKDTPDTEEILEILPPDYYLDGQPVQEPEGYTGSEHIEARFLLVVNHRSLKKNLAAAIQARLKSLGVSIAGFFVSPLAAAEAVLTGSEKNSGYALVELGAGLTYFSIYKGGRLKYLATIPLGAAAITKDICSLDLTEKEAEELKVKYGNALVTYGNDGAESAPEIAAREELKEFDFVVEARSNEIIANIKAQIDRQGWGTLAGIVITGGGIGLKKFDTSLKQKTSLPVSSAKKSPVNFPGERLNPPEYATITGLLVSGKENCAKKEEEKPPVIVEPPQPPTTPIKPTTPAKKKVSLMDKFKKGVGTFTGNLFDDDNQ
ncbi:MAG: cell division protein FtsA [Candidatus Symbiothrix sp.]|jgi:cell division protein FtsA|nr:cell division protein FtsA [Candidatus Symbiothrix sp.]